MVNNLETHFTVLPAPAYVGISTVYVGVDGSLRMFCTYVTNEYAYSMWVYVYVYRCQWVYGFEMKYIRFDPLKRSFEPGPEPAIFIILISSAL